MSLDKDLITSFQKGDIESYEVLVLKHRKKALDFARNYIKDWHIAEDIVQECFAYIFVHSEKYNNKYSFKTYLYTIIRNKSIDYIRKNDKYYYCDNIEIVSKFSLEDKIIEDEKVALLKKCMEQLKADYQIVLELIDYEGFSYKETALIMDKSLMQVKVLIYRARRKLGALLEAEGM